MSRKVNGGEFRAMIAHMGNVLGKQHALRNEYAGIKWLDAEIDCMHAEVNRLRNSRAMTDVSRLVVVRHERAASGHTDYAHKFALYCAELALGISPNHKES